MEALLSNNPHLYPPLLSIAPSIFQEVAGLVGAFRRFAHLCGDDFVRVAVGLGGDQQGHPPWVARCEKKVLGEISMENPMEIPEAKSLNEGFIAGKKKHRTILTFFFKVAVFEYYRA